MDNATPIKTATPDDSLTLYCHQCKNMFQSSSAYENHLQSLSARKPCPFCSEDFASLCSLDLHCHLAHNGGPDAIPPPPVRKLSPPHKDQPKDVFLCKVCSRVFLHRSSFRAHEPTHTGVKPFQCNICQKRFALQWNLVSHLHTHTGIRRYKCHKCNSMFARSTTLREHMQVHLPLHEKPICRCELCGKIFRSKKSLSGHKMVHSKKRPFMCDICDRGFVSRRNLRNHQKVHLNAKLFRCDACDIWFRNAANLAVHRSEKHFTPEYTRFPNIIAELSTKIECSAEFLASRKYPCEKCGSKFEEKQQWVNHMQAHFVDQFRCICYQCGTANANIDELRAHLLQHSEEVPPPPSVSPPKLSLSNYDLKYFIAFFANNGIDVAKDGQKGPADFVPPPPPEVKEAELSSSVVLDHQSGGS